MNEVWKHKLIFVETPDANETSIALENYRRVLHSLGNSMNRMLSFLHFLRLVITAVVLFFSLSLVERCQKASILIIITAVLSSCLGKCELICFIYLAYNSILHTAFRTNIRKVEY